MILSVVCHAGYRADERPLRFTLGAPAGRSYAVKEVLDQWHGVGYRCFRVLADDDNVYILRHSEADDVWSLDSYRRGPR